MKQLFAGAAMAALVAVAFAGVAEAKAKPGHRMHRHAGIYYSWCCGPYSWGPAHARSDFVANQMNRRELGLVAYNGALGMDQVMLNPQPLPPKAR